MKTTFTLLWRSLALFCAIFLFPAAVQAQIGMGPRLNSYTQNFDGLPATGTAIWESGSYYFPGWSVHRSKAGNTIVANSGSGNTGALLNYGSTGSTDRALGSIASANAGEFAYTLLLQNNTGSTIYAVDVSYTGEQWRLINMSAPQHMLAFSYATSHDLTGFSPSPTVNSGWVQVPELNFMGPKFGSSGVPLDGNAAENRQLLKLTLNVEVPHGHYLMLRWLDRDEKDHDHGLAIDDVTVTWHTQPLEAPAPLPVELAYFSASVQDEQVALHWQTASEDQNSHFVVERSPDGKAFESIGTVTGKGTTVQTTNYTYRDLQPLQGLSYYRLKQVDEDESYTYSKVVAVNRKVTQELHVFPTLTSDHLQVRSGLRLWQAVVSDATGRKLLEQQLRPMASQHHIEVGHLKNGAYVLVLLDEKGRRYVRRFVKQ